MITWQIHTPPGERTLDWLKDVSELRGQVFYEDGRRPAFKLADGRFADPDPLDLHAHHIIASSSGRAVGCVRLVPVVGTPAGVTEQLLGPARFAEMLASVGVTRTQAVGCERWVADPDCRGSRVGVLLAAGAVAAARSLGFKLLFCSVGTRARQDRILSRLGLRPVAGFPLIDVPTWNDAVRVMSIDPSRPPPHFAALMQTMDGNLGLIPSENLGASASDRQLCHEC